MWCRIKRVTCTTVVQLFSFSAVYLVGIHMYGSKTISETKIFKMVSNFRFMLKNVYQDYPQFLNFFFNDKNELMRIFFSKITCFNRLFKKNYQVQPKKTHWGPLQLPLCMNGLKHRFQMIKNITLLYDYDHKNKK